jgi:putative chitinase
MKTHENTILEILKNNKEKEAWCEILLEVLPMYSINTNLRLAHFFSQCCHESKDFTELEESLNYSVEALKQDKRFANGLAELYGRTAAQKANQKMIGSIKYANRIGNADVNSGDGHKYRGRGIIQLTGKANYTICSKDLSLPEILDNPDCVASNKEIALKTACWFWSKNNLNALADKDDLAMLTKRINGGDNGLSDRKERLEKYKILLSC